MHNPIITFSVLSQKPWTSDTFPAFLSEVPFESPGPPTLSRISVGGGHKASRASPLGRARAACFECSALVPAEHGAVGRESLLIVLDRDMEAA